MPTLADLQASATNQSSSSEKRTVSDSLIADCRNQMRPTQFIEEKLRKALQRQQAPIVYQFGN